MSPNDSMTVAEAVKIAERMKRNAYRYNQFTNEEALSTLIAHAKSAPKEQRFTKEELQHKLASRMMGKWIPPDFCNVDIGAKFIVDLLDGLGIFALPPTEPTFTAGEVDAKLSSVPCFSGCHIKFPLHSRTCGDCYVYQIRQQSSKIRTILGGQ